MKICIAYLDLSHRELSKKKFQLNFIHLNLPVRRTRCGLNPVEVLETTDGTSSSIPTDCGFTDLMLGTMILEKKASQFYFFNRKSSWIIFISCERFNWLKGDFHIKMGIVFKIKQDSFGPRYNNKCIITLTKSTLFLIFLIDPFKGLQIFSQEMNYIKWWKIFNKNSKYICFLKCSKFILAVTLLLPQASISLSCRFYGICIIFIPFLVNLFFNFIPCKIIYGFSFFLKKLPTFFQRLPYLQTWLLPPL